MRFETILLILFTSCAVPLEVSRQAGSGGPGSDTSHGLPQAFQVFDANVGGQLDAIERAVQKLRRSITIRYRDAVMARSLPMLRRMHADAQQAADAGRWHEAGSLLQGTMVATELVALEANLVLVADWADQVGQSSFQIAGQISDYDEQMKPLLVAALSGDPTQLAAALPEGSRRFEWWLLFVDHWCALVRDGAELSHNVIRVLDAAMLIYSVQAAAEVAAEAFTAGLPPPPEAVFPGGVAAATEIDIATLEAMHEAIRKLLAAGVLDPAVVAGMGQFGAAAARPGLISPASFAMQGTKLPEASPMTKEPGQWKKTNEAMSDRAQRYQIQRGGRPGEVYKVGGVKFDAIRDGKLIEAKGTGYTSFVEKNGSGQFKTWFREANQLVMQAKHQLAVSKAVGMPLQWEVAEAKFADALRKLFNQNGLEGVSVVWEPLHP